MTLITTTIGTQGTEPTRDELRRRDRERFAMRANLPELRRTDLTFTRFSILHEPTGDEYRVYSGEINTGPEHPIAAFYYDAAGGAVVFLERLRGGR